MHASQIEIERPGEAATSLTIAIVIPAYRARATIRRVIARALPEASFVVVVDDACPEATHEAIEPDERVHVLRHEVNRGVGGAVKTGIAHALSLGADVIVKVDADDQMDVGFLPFMVRVLERHPEVDLVKGNRFADPETVRVMPAVRLIGNAGLSLLVKISSGYWTISDPTNGFVALRADALRRIDVAKLSERYFFEIDLLCAMGTARRLIAEFEMPPRYAGEHSSLSIGNVLVSFPPKLLARLMRRLFVNYVLMEMNVGTMFGIIGIPLFVAALVFGGHEWYVSVKTGVPRATGTIILALLLFTTGFQLTLQALFYDVQFSPKTLRVRRGLDSGDFT
ncbi:MAG: glycosyltransferase family 2 protein [Candidatus Eremiobacteraeota bacterium]|nr:glycosyltransferase family 2 protein [Candidatus Eremiobacteraeota bacterium]